MKFDETQRAAIEKSCKFWGKKAFAEKCRVPICSPGQWIKGRAKGCTAETYERLYQFIKEHLPDDPLGRWLPLSLQGRQQTNSGISDDDMRDKLNDGAIAIGFRWMRLCHDQQLQLEGYLARLEEDAATKKDTHFASSKAG